MFLLSINPSDRIILVLSISRDTPPPLSAREEGRKKHGFRNFPYTFFHGKVLVFDMFSSLLPKE
jgi:hypothetical protein